MILRFDAASLGEYQLRSDRGLKEDCSRAVSKTEFISDPVPEDFSDCVEAAVAGLGPIPGKLTWCRFLFYCPQDCAWGLRRAVNKGGTSEEGSSESQFEEVDSRLVRYIDGESFT